MVLSHVLSPVMGELFDRAQRRWQGEIVEAAEKTAKMTAAAAAKKTGTSGVAGAGAMDASGGGETKPPPPSPSASALPSSSPPPPTTTMQPTCPPIAELLTPASSVPGLEGFDADAAIRAHLPWTTYGAARAAAGRGGSGRSAARDAPRLAELEPLPEYLAERHSSAVCETFTIPDTDSRASLRGQLGVRSKVRIPKHTLLAPYGQDRLCTQHKFARLKA